jgi:hypothetical protein
MTPLIFIIVTSILALSGYLGYKALLRKRQADHPPISIVYLLKAPRRMSEEQLVRQR